MGAGRGVGARPEQADQVATYDTRVRGQLHRGGRAEVSPTPFGPVVPGDSVAIPTLPGEQTKTVVDPGAIDREVIPRLYKQHARQYIDALNRP